MAFSGCFFLISIICHNYIKLRIQVTHNVIYLLSKKKNDVNGHPLSTKHGPRCCSYREEFASIFILQELRIRQRNLCQNQLKGTKACCGRGSFMKIQKDTLVLTKKKSLDYTSGRVKFLLGLQLK